MEDSLTEKRVELLDRARRTDLTLTIEIDVVVAGSGFMALYYLGVLSVLQAIGGLRIARVAGASSGAMLPMEIAVLGIERVMDLYLAYGKLQSENPASFAASAWRADRHWKMWATELFQEESARVAVSGFAHASVTRLAWRGLRNVVYETYATLDLARSVYYATGTIITSCDGYYCTDGGVTLAVPVFEDQKRPQLVVRPGSCGLSKNAVAKFDHRDVEDFVKLGQDDTVAFLQENFRSGSVRQNATNASRSLDLVFPPLRTSAMAASTKTKGSRS